MTDCTKCFHYGLSIPHNRIECCIAHKYAVCPGNCREFVEVKG